MSRRRIHLAAAAIAALALVSSLGAAAAPAALVGRVVDAQGAPLPGARVTAFAEGSAVTLAASADTTSDGGFTLFLEPGRYVLHVKLDRFAEAIEMVSLGAEGSPVRDFVLRNAGVRSSVIVTAPPDSYLVPSVTSATKTSTPLRDVPQSVTVVTRQLMQDQLMTSIGDVVRYVPGVGLLQGENNRDQLVMRGNSTSADFFVDGVRDDVQYYRDLYNLDRVEALKGPNAMIFGRGGAGGVINRVTKQAGFDATREIDLQGGSWGDKRVSADVDQPLGENLALRLNGVYEDSGSFRTGVDLKRWGVAPTLTFLPGDTTKVTLGYEHFNDGRTADRGISSYQGRPADVDISTYYGNASDSHVRADVDIASLTIEQRLGAATLRNKTLFGDYDRGYQNYVPGAVTADKSQVALTAYNNATKRQSLFNQTDLTYALTTGSLKHTFLVGAEEGRQLTDNFRNTGFFNGTASSILVPYADPTIATTATFRQSATDADNHLRTNLFAAYAQDQVELSPAVQLLAGVRFDRFDLLYHNNRGGDDLGRVDNLVSPRAGIVVHPATRVSVYGSYSVSYLPSSGDQFSSLTTITDQLEPERFTNYEVGAKWDASAALSLTMASYRLDRTNTRSTDPNDPTKIVQTGSQRTNGVEVGVNGRLASFWTVAGGYAYQDAFVTSATTAAAAGAVVAQVPKHTLSLWNNWQIVPRLGAAVGVIYRSAMFATIDDTVVLPGYTRLDAAAFFSLTGDLRLQVNVENLFGAKYYANADSNTNISPGAPRAARVGLVARF